MVYRKEIDGLRAIAVVPVVFFHAGFPFFGGGFVGVDVFFVISGYLITTLILSETNAGKFSLCSFYERRARRILPALYFVMIVILPFAWSWMFLQERKDFFQSLSAVSIFASNFLFWKEADYFGGAAEYKPLIHTWTLAIEEQYYILFPIFLLIIFRFGVAITICVFAIIGFVSLYISEISVQRFPTTAFFLLPARLWELLLGSLTAVYLLQFDNIQKRILATASISPEILSGLGLFLIGYSVFTFDNRTAFPGLNALIPTMGAVLIILFQSDNVMIGRFLRSGFFVKLGLISYSFYLWHQPLFALSRIRCIEPPTFIIKVFLVILAFGLAFLTWKYVEKPFRDLTNFTRAQIFVGVSVFSVIFFGLGVVGHLTNGFFFPSWVGEKSLTALSYRIRTNFGLSMACGRSFTTSEECRTHDRPDIVVWGDSFAMHLIPGIFASNSNAKLIQMTASECGPIVGLSIVGNGITEQEAKKCLEFNGKVIEWIENNKSVKFVILASPFDGYFKASQYFLAEYGYADAQRELLLKYFTLTLGSLQDMGVTPVVFAPPPANQIDMGSCLVKSVYHDLPLDRCNIGLRRREDKGELVNLLRSISNNFKVVWLSDGICDENVCRAEIDGTFIYRDSGHLSYEGSAYLGKKMDFYKLITDGSSGVRSLGQ